MKYTLEGVDGNAFAIMAYVKKAMKDEKFTKEEIDEYGKKAMSGDYKHLLYVSLSMVSKLNNNEEFMSENEFNLIADSEIL